MVHRAPAWDPRVALHGRCSPPGVPDQRLLCLQSAAGATCSRPSAGIPPLPTEWLGGDWNRDLPVHLISHRVQSGPISTLYVCFFRLTTFHGNCLFFLKLINYLFIFISWRLITLQYCSGFCRFQCVSYSIISLLHWFTINVRCIISWITKKGKMLPVSQATIVQCSLISEILKYGKWWVVKPMKYGITIFDKWMNMKVVYKIYFHSLSVETLYNIWTKTSKKSFHPWFTVEHVS